MGWHRLVAGTRLEMVAHFDNTAANLRNPNCPPRTVRWGEQTTDEMAIAFIEVAPQRQAERREELRLPTRAEALRFLIAGQSARGGDDADGPSLLDRLRQLTP